MGSCKENIGTYLGKSLLFYECCSVLFWFLPSYQSSPSFHLSLVPLSTIHLSSSLVLPKVASESTLEVFLLEELLCSSHKNKTKNWKCYPLIEVIIASTQNLEIVGFSQAKSFIRLFGVHLIQCDQIAILLFNLWPFTAMTICPVT